MAQIIGNGKTLAQGAKEMHALLSRKGAWTQGFSARDAKGQPVNSESKLAVSWCLVGAMWRVFGTANGVNQPLLDCIRKQRGSEKYTTIAQWNDAKSRKKSQILRAVKCLQLSAQTAG